ncbi:hypothetical protein HGRIS_008566 [Hohenbuehelia grisea]|uniref:DH domain-containing protein n=1 Tax=Hohenbuehelia grisea TaxID=104357 RepID=A0ABR3J9E6_9AGAR
MYIPPKPVGPSFGLSPLPVLSPCSSSSDESFFSMPSGDGAFSVASGFSARSAGNWVAFPLSPEEPQSGDQKDTFEGLPKHQKPLPALPPLETDGNPLPTPNPPFLLYSARPILRSMSARRPPVIRRQRNVSMPSRLAKPWLNSKVDSVIPRHGPTRDGQSSDLSKLSNIDQLDSPVQPQELQDVSPSDAHYRWRTVGSDAVASLAWTGHFSSPTSPILSQPHSGHATSFLLPLPTSVSGASNTIDRAPVSGEDTSALPPSKRCEGAREDRSWTLAMAIADPRITDELLLEELENVRVNERVWERQGIRPPSLPVAIRPADSGFRARDYSPRSPIRSNTISYARDEWITISLPQSLKLPTRSLSDPSAAQAWQTARRALLVCRELVRTELNYLACLRLLMANGTSTPPPATMLELVPPLLMAGESLLKQFQNNPSALGTSEAFTSSEDALHAPFVAWCTVVGDFFAQANGGEEQSLRSRSAPLRRKLSAWTRNKGFLSSWTTSTVSDEVHDTPTVSKATVRELAILPTQRVTRYVLLFKDLLRHTPQTSPSRTWVEKAVASACRLAQACDEAQKNVAFAR